MRTRTWALVWATGAVGVAAGGCGITTEEYDARVAELRVANERYKQCDDTVRGAHTGLNEALHGVDELTTKVSELQAERVNLGIDTEDGRVALRRSMEGVARERQSGAARAALKAQLMQRLRDELEAGVVWLDERFGTIRVAIPEEVLFATGSSALGPPGKKVLDAVAREIKSVPARRLLVAGYKDARPNPKPDKQVADLLLTTDRAKHVAEYLAKQGVDAGRLAAVGLGGLDPIADNATDEGQTRNRRIEIQLFDAVAPASASPRKVDAAPGRTTPAPAPPPPFVAPRAPVAPPPSAIDDPGL